MLFYIPNITHTNTIKMNKRKLFTKIFSYIKFLQRYKSYLQNQKKIHITHKNAQLSSPKVMKQKKCKLTFPLELRILKQPFELEI